MLAGNIAKTPKWVRSYVHPYTSVHEVPDVVFDVINKKLDKKLSDNPEVSIVIAAWNEEINILNCISSLSDLRTDIRFEIIVINNNSTDRTADTLEKLNVRTLFEAVPGCGPARQRGQESARGKYILLADADCIYPYCWLDALMSKLRSDGVVCVYGRYSFIDKVGFSRWKLFLLEKMKDCIAEVRHFKRPYLNAYGISMGYIKELGLRVKYVDYKVWGDDGRLCFDLMQYGKVCQVRDNKARAWTPPRTLQRDGNFWSALRSRISIELGRFFSLFTPHPPHDTKISKNE